MGVTSFQYSFLFCAVNQLRHMRPRLLPPFLFLFLLGHLADAQRVELNKKDTAEVVWMTGKKFYSYKVEKGETLFSISKRFKVSQDELHKNNPELKNGLKVKMLLLIPADSSRAEVSEKKESLKEKRRKEHPQVSI